MTKHTTTYATDPEGTERHRPDISSAIYAAAGAGELAYQKLRQLPEATARTLRTASETAGEFRQRLNYRGDLTTELTQVRSQVRQSARRGAEVLAARAATAQEKAATGYRNLVARGERVVGDRFGAATGHTEPPTKVEVEVGEPERETPPVAGDKSRGVATPGTKASGRRSDA